MHERMTALRRIAIVTVEKGTPRTEIWRAIAGAASFKADCGKICIAVNEDIDPDNSDALLWAMAFRMNPADDMQVLRHRSRGHGPEREHESEDEDATMLMVLNGYHDVVTFTVPGTYRYDCAVHGQAMSGTIVVQ